MIVLPKKGGAVWGLVGNLPNLKGLNLDKVGVEVNNNSHVVTNDYFKTSIDSIFAWATVDRVKAKCSIPGR